VGFCVEDVNEYRFGIAFTNPKDNYCKRKGVEFARIRAEQQPFMVVPGAVVDSFGGSIRFVNAFISTVKYHSKYFMKLRKNLIDVE